MSYGEADCLRALFISVEEPTLHTISITDGIDINIKMFSTDIGQSQPTCLTMWPMSLVLARYILEHPDRFENRTVIELGSGVGITGVVAARISERVLLTDGDEQCINIIKENCNINDVHNADVRVLKWSDDVSADGIDASQYDIAIGSDVAYDPNSLNALFACLAQFKRSVMTFKSRSFVDYNDIITCAHKHHLIRDVEIDMGSGQFIFEFIKS